MRNYIEMEEVFYVTNYQFFTEAQAEQNFKNKISELSYEILIGHLCEPELATYIEGFTEQNGVLFVKVGEEMISITKSSNK